MDELGSNKLFETKRPIPNTIFIGDIDCYNDMLTYTEDMFNDPAVPARYQANVLDRDIWSTMTRSIDSSNVTQQVMQLAFNEEFYIDNPMFRQVFKDCSDEQLQEIFKRNNWVACILRENTKGQPHIYKISITNKKQLQDAIKAKAIVVPSEMYRTMVLGVNKHKIDSRTLATYRRTVAGSYKSSYLTILGFPFRNFLDSVIYKNAATTTGMTAILDNLEYSYKAAKLDDWYTKLQQRMSDLAMERYGIKTMKSDIVKEVLSELSDNDKRTYILLDTFYRSGASPGLSKVMQDIVLDINMTNKTLNQSLLEAYIDEAIYEHGPVKWINTINDKVETTARLGLFLNLVDNGLKVDDAIRKIIETHFDYELSSVQLRNVEDLLWFSVFPMNNVLYYLNEGLTKNPDMLKLQMDALELSYNDGEFTWDDVRNSSYLSYNALAGNIRFKFNGKNVVVKTGSSVMDFFQWLTNPLGSVQDRVNPFMSVLFGWENVNQLNPLDTHISRFKKVIKGESLVPSIYTVLKEHNYPKHSYIEREPYVKATWANIPKYKGRIRKPNNLAKRHYKVYTKRYYFARKSNNYKWMTNTVGLVPYFLNETSRYHRASLLSAVNKYKRSNSKYLRTIKKLQLPTTTPPQ